MPSEIEETFPNLKDTEYEITGDASDDYNCIAWALSATSPWWGFQNPGEYWPPSLPRNQQVWTIVQLFANEGFTLCADDSLEIGFEKIAIYEIVGQFTHVARQLDDGRWTSKFGNRETITHQSPVDLTGTIYGNVHCIMRRPTASNP